MWHISLSMSVPPCLCPDHVSVCLHNGILSVKRKKKMLPFVMWMDLEGTVLSTMSQTEKINTASCHYIWSLKRRESRKVVARGWGWGDKGNRERVVKVCKVSAIKCDLRI